MKKSIVLIALALALMVPVFAANTGSSTASTTPVVVDTKDANGKAQPVGDTTPLKNAANKTTVTEVGVTLDLYPIYYSAITNSDVTADATKITRYNYDSDDTFKNVDKIVMSVDTDTYKLKESDKKYISCFFYENTEDVKLTVTLDSNLTTDTEPLAGDAESKKVIRYVANIDMGDSNKETLHSDTAKGDNSFGIWGKSATKKVADSQAKSFAFTLSQEEGDDLKKNLAGYYTSTITLSLASN